MAANWIGLDGLIDIKRQIADPRHQDDVRVLEAVRELRQRGDGLHRRRCDLYMYI